MKDAGANGGHRSYLRQQLPDWRRDIHRHPELAFEARRTLDLVAGRLAEWGIDVFHDFGNIGEKRPCMT